MATGRERETVPSIAGLRELGNKNLEKGCVPAASHLTPQSLRPLQEQLSRKKIVFGL